ncbi:MAG: enterochelin esterase domain-containing protein [Castellaniella sp.]|uniref:enterochelin esterase domain-containing protein n=1 Tax=Castellaniella sp. TaxID=1955812 RepID=UPI003A8AF62B
MTPRDVLKPWALARAVFAAALVWVLTAAPASAVPMQRPDAVLSSADVGRALSGRLAAGQALQYTADLPVGHVVQGSFAGVDASLDLEDADGRHLRRLENPGGGGRDWMWVVPADPVRLVVRARAASTFRLTVTRVLAPAASPVVPVVDPVVPESPRLRALMRHLDRGGSTEPFWRGIRRQGTPLVEPLSATESLVTFLWRGARDNVRLFGGPSGDHAALHRLGESDLWWVSFRMADTARLSYRLAPDVPRIQGTPRDQRRVILATAQRDPFNPRVFPAFPPAPLDAFQGDSVLELPQAPPQPWIRRRPGVQSGVLLHERLTSKVLGNERDVWIYRPAGAAPRALLVWFDAHEYLTKVHVPTIIDNLLADGLIPPVAVVLVGNPSSQARARELPPNAAFTRFLAKEFMPWLQTRGLDLPAPRTVIGGSSYGGLAAAQAGLALPHRFGNVLSLSGSYWWSPDGEPSGWVMRQYAAAPKRDVRFYLDAGQYERSRAGTAGILETNRRLAGVLRDKGYDVTQVEHEAGHDYFHWQGSLGCGLVALLNPARAARGLVACRAEEGASR